MTLSTALVERSSGFLERRLSRRNVINRSAFVGSAVAVGAGLDLALKPGTAYGKICECGNAGCGCGSTCCSGFTDFCCSVTGFNYCPSNTMMGGWWMADNSSYCNGPRYYMDCNAICACDNGCSDGFPFCEPGCDLTGGCGCGPNGCDSYLTNCLQFRYGQCNQDIACMGRIVCRVVACVPPWTVDPTCTTAVAVDNATAEQNEPCWTATPPCPSATPTNCQVVTMIPSADGGGYTVVTAFGKSFPYGDFVSEGDVSNVTLSAPIVSAAFSMTGGYWFAGSDGGVFAFGKAPYQGSMGGDPLNGHIVGMAATPTGNGYWLVAADGGIFAFGDATFLGSMGGKPLNAPVVGMACTPSGRGYWLVAADGGIFSYGDAPFLGSMGGKPLNKPIVGMAATVSGTGYWLVAADGGVFSYGDAAFDGSTGSIRLNLPIVGMAPSHNDGGYWLVARDGGIFAFGGAPFLGTPA
jgi:hypothetical protein